MAHLVLLGRSPAPTLRALMEPNFTGPSYTIGIEEELMILDGRSLGLENAIGKMVEGDGSKDQVKPELHESVLEISTLPASNTREAGNQLRSLRGHVSEVAARHGLRIGSAGTHPFARWEDQRISADEHYRALVRDLR